MRSFGLQSTCHKMPAMRRGPSGVQQHAAAQQQQQQDDGNVAGERRHVRRRARATRLFRRHTQSCRRRAKLRRTRQRSANAKRQIYARAAPTDGRHCAAAVRNKSIFFTTRHVFRPIASRSYTHERKYAPIKKVFGSRPKLVDRRVKKLKFISSFFSAHLSARVYTLV